MRPDNPILGWFSLIAGAITLSLCLVPVRVLLIFWSWTWVIHPVFGVRSLSLFESFALLLLAEAISGSMFGTRFKYQVK
jgi:hypothetical protein